MSFVRHSLSRGISTTSDADASRTSFFARSHAGAADWASAIVASPTSEWIIKLVLVVVLISGGCALAAVSYTFALAAEQAAFNSVRPLKYLLLGAPLPLPSSLLPPSSSSFPYLFAGLQ